jgi:hypothetical protein
MSTAAAPTATAAAPTNGNGNAPSEGGIRISLPVRNALFADLVAYYHSADSGDTRLDKIKAVRDRAREEYAALLEGEDNEELNSSEQQDLRTLIDWVISGGTAAAQRTYYPPLAAPGYGGGAPGPGYFAPGGVAYQATTLWVPVIVQPQHHLHHLFHKP